MLPAGSKLSVKLLYTDVRSRGGSQSHVQVVAGAVYGASIPGSPPKSQTYDLLGKQGAKGPITEVQLAPIITFQVNVVQGPGQPFTLFTKGGGTLNDSSE